MGKIEVKAGTMLHNESQLVGKLEIVLSGTIQISNSNMSFQCGSGTIIGALETPNTLYALRYTTVDDCVLYEYDYRNQDDFEKLVISNPKIAANLVTATVNGFAQINSFYSKMLVESGELFTFVKNSYENYEKLCESLNVGIISLPSIEEAEEYHEEDSIAEWKLRFFKVVRMMKIEEKRTVYSNPYMALAVIMDAKESSNIILGQMSALGEYLHEIASLVISDAGGDFFDLYSNLVFRASKNPFADTTKVEAAVSKLIIYMQGLAYIDKSIVDHRAAVYRSQLQEIEDMLLSDEPADSAMTKDACDAIENSLSQILEYAGYPENEGAEFTSLVEKYRVLSDKSSTEDGPRKLRRDITNHFYSIYEKIFAKTRDGSINNIPVLIRMFLYFGYVDEELAGRNNALVLYNMAKDKADDPNGRVLTVYEWLLKVYKGQEEPSKNEFDLDYYGYLREEKHQGNITAKEEEALKTDLNNKAIFEIKNVFTLGNRITYGRITTFCPLFSEHNVLRPMETMLLTPTKVDEIFDEIRRVDFNCFYRDVIYTNPKIGINREYIGKEVLPYVILMPNVGNRGSLWQEISGVKRDTPGRILISIFSAEDPTDTFIKLAGEFKWELCKRIQGVHWNDVTDPSLTAEYCDYLQFYRKNHELSQDAKEKIKLSIQKAKNNYRNVFVADYLTWVKFEGNGSPRLNRYVRGIMFRYCPFPKEIREEVSSNPLYSEILERYKTKQAQKIHSVNLVVQKVTKDGNQVPDEIYNQLDFLQR